MSALAHQYYGFDFAANFIDVPLGIVLPGYNGELLCEFCFSGTNLNLQAHEELATLGASELLAFGDIALSLNNSPRDGVDYARLVSANEGQDPVVYWRAHRLQFRLR